MPIFTHYRLANLKHLQHLSSSCLAFGLVLFFYTSAGLHAQCWPEGFTHDTRPQQMWLSCASAESPNPDRGESLWLQYDLGFTYSLTTSKIWNYNEPNLLDLGVRRLAIDYSLDGDNWINWGEIDLELATGRRDYAGELGPDFNGADARYVLFTVLSTGTPLGDCAGLAEVQFNLGGTVSTDDPGLATALEVFPNPAKDYVDIRLNNSGLQLVELFDQQGRLLQRHETSGAAMQLNVQRLPAGVYMLKVLDEDRGLYQERLVIL